MSELQDLDHERAKEAGERLHAAFKGARSQKDLKGYRTVALQAPVYLRQVGLIQLVAFWLSKKGAEVEVLKHLLGWLERAPSTKEICAQKTEQQGRNTLVTRRPLKYSARFDEIAGPLLARTAEDVAILEAEAEAFLGWIKRLVEGRYQNLPKKPMDPHGTP